MRDVRQIKPEWIPNAYKDDPSPVTAAEIKPKPANQTTLYSGNKTRLKSRINKAYKKP